MTNQSGLQLFTVTLPWNPNNSDEGDYSVKCWSSDSDAAIRAIAEEMADHRDSGVDKGDERARAEFVDNIVQAAGPYAAECIGAGLIGTVSEFLAGLLGTLTEAAAQDLATVKTILARYGAFAG